MAEPRRDDIVLEYPNRDKASSKTTKAVVVLLIIVSAVLMAIVAVGGWDALQGAKLILVGYILIYLLLAYFIARWRSGMLPVIAALATVLGIFAAVSAPEWFARDKDGFSDPAIASSLLGLITVLLVPVSLLLIAFAMSGFKQAWHVEVERRVGNRGRDDYDDRGGYEPSPATA